MSLVSDFFDVNLRIVFIVYDVYVGCNLHNSILNWIRKVCKGSKIRSPALLTGRKICQVQDGCPAIFQSFRPSIWRFSCWTSHLILYVQCNTNLGGENGEFVYIFQIPTLYKDKYGRSTVFPKPGNNYKFV